MDRSLETPWVQISYSLWFLHSNSTMPLHSVFNPKYRRCSPPSNRCLPGHDGTSVHTSSTTSAISKPHVRTSVFCSLFNPSSQTKWPLTLFLFGDGSYNMFALHFQHHLKCQFESIVTCERCMAMETYTSPQLITLQNTHYLPCSMYINRHYFPVKITCSQLEKRALNISQIREWIHNWCD